MVYLLCFAPIKLHTNECSWLLRGTFSPFLSLLSALSLSLFVRLADIQIKQKSHRLHVNKLVQCGMQIYHNFCARTATEAVTDVNKIDFCQFGDIKHKQRVIMMFV